MKFRGAKYSSTNQSPFTTMVRNFRKVVSPNTRIDLKFAILILALAGFAAASLFGWQTSAQSQGASDESPKTQTTPNVGASPNPAILATAGASNRIVVFPDPENAPSTQNLVPGLPADAVPHGVAYSGSDGALVSDFNHFRIFVVQASTASLVSTIDTSSAGYSGTGTIAVAPNQTAALAMGGNDQLYVIQAPFGPSSAISALTLPGIIPTFQTQAIVFDGAGRGFIQHSTGISVLDAPYTSVTFTMSNFFGHAVAISPDGNTLLASGGSRLKIFSAPFSGASTPTELIIPGGTLFLNGIAMTPDGSKAIVAGRNDGSLTSFAAVISAPFNSTSIVEGFTLPADNNGSEGFEDVGISFDGQTAILTGGSFTRPAVKIQAPFSASSVTSNLPIVGAANPARGAGAVRFLPPAAPPRFSLTKAAPASVISGENLTYTINYSNISGGAVSNVVIRDPLPAGTTFVSATNGGTQVGGDIIFNLGAISAGANGNVSFTVTVNTAVGGTVLNNSYRIEGDGGPPVTGAPVTTNVVARGPALGNYPNTIVVVGANTTVVPDAAPGAVVTVNVSTHSDFKGILGISPTTGVVRVTNAHPAGSYLVEVKASDAVGTTTRTFTLTVTSGTVCNGTIQFTDAANVSTGSGPRSVAIGDFNNDGNQDLATANENTTTVSIRLGDGSGGFSGSTNVTVGSNPASVAIGDFNNDGNQDLAAANQFSNTVSISLGNGLGGFSGSTNVSTGATPFSVAIGDFNNDGNQDFAAANIDAGTVSIRLGNGSGAFSGTTNVNVGSLSSFPISVAIADFNNDGYEDFAVANQGSDAVIIRVGDGLGGFSGTNSVSVGGQPFSVVVGDFDNDGDQDLAAASIVTDTISIRLGDGLGGFSGLTEVSVEADPVSVVIGDFNNDGKQDLAAANQTSNTVSVRVGDGFGSFSGMTNISVGNAPKGLAIGDFNNNGKQDFATANQDSNSSSVRLGSCFNAPTAAMVSVGGRVLTANGRGIGKANVSIMDGSGNIRTAITNGFGYYSLDGVLAGEIYLVSVQSKRYQFANPTQVISVLDELTDVNFVALP